MPNYTNNLNLEKPLQSENYNIDIFNSNADKIDTAIQEIKGKVDGLELKAEKVTIADSGNYFTSNNVEGALSELAAEINGQRLRGINIANAIIDKLEGITKTFVVRGNNDKDEWGLTLPEYKEIEMDEVLIYVVHNNADIPKDLKEVDLIIYGHSNKFSNKKIDDIVYLNPGSCGRKRFSLPLSMAIVEINLDDIKIEKIDLN